MHHNDPERIALNIIQGGPRDDWKWRGFFREEHNVPGEPVYVAGDRAKFDADKEQIAVRTKRRLDALENRFWIVDPIHWWG